MKKRYALLFPMAIGIGIVPLASYSQTVTSVAAGDFYSPTTWDCTCVPADSDTIYVNHAVVLDFGISYSGGLLQVGGAGSLTDGGAGNGIYVDGGHITNIGMINCSGVLLESGSFSNLAQLNVDSLWTRDTISNIGIITITVDFRHDLNGHFTNSGTITVGDGFLNEAIFLNNSEVHVYGDFANYNLSGPNATFDISGTMCVYNDFYNGVDDTMLGNGTITISGTSVNEGEMMGNFIIQTPGGALTSNTGNIAPGISFATGACDSGVEENKKGWDIYPNPAENFVISTEPDIRYELYDFSGRIVSAGYSEDGMLNVGTLEPGIYVVRMVNANGWSSVSTFQKR
jgi:hypothetical protein